MHHNDGDLAANQQDHWQRTYAGHPAMYGEEPSAAAVHAATVFHAHSAQDVLELGAGHGRDALHFAREGFTVQATDFSDTGLEQLNGATRAQDVTERVTTAVHDVREALPLPDACVDGVFAHMLLCMALSTKETPSATLATPITVPAPRTAMTSTNTAASPCTSSPVTSSTPLPRAGPSTRSTPSRKANCHGACGESPRHVPNDRHDRAMLPMHG
ncbi:class I SAM-dependent methyltransferase [Streptomyces sp. NBC_00377]|uniref:class I SAM-dependent methyltransferase n=1 Tax=unclassified Streptomyces TaxID=2593676 RepID=UPI002E1E6ACE|nr:MULTISPECIES: class I SAM-dependent methyltransferase [unclassified Streptomyces]